MVLQASSKKGGAFEVLSGTSFSLFAMQSAKIGYGGLEYAAGIPGSIGGAIFMNAGASGQEIASLVESVDYINEDGKYKCYPKEELLFKYRWSSFHKMKGFIFSASLRLYPDAAARKVQIELINKRKQTQPLKEPSCGCVFRNGKEFIAGKLIDEMNLKGLQIGGAQVSNTHGNFIINRGSAKAQDVKDLVQIIEDNVFEKTQYKLEREIRYVPYQRN